MSKKFEPLVTYDSNHVAIEEVYFNQWGSITGWYLYSPHCDGGLVKQSLEIMQTEWPKHWNDMLDKIDERLNETKLTDYHNAIQSKVESLFDQDRDEKSVS